MFIDSDVLNFYGTSGVLSTALSISACSTVATTLDTAEDGKISFQINSKTGFPEGAEDDRAKVITTAIYFKAKEQNEYMPSHGFSYQVEFKKGYTPISIKVEDETEKPLTLEMEDKTPVLNNSIWSGLSKLSVMNDAVFAQMVKQGDWYLIRKFTITYSDGQTRVLHQLARITSAMRIRALENIAKYGKKS